MSKKSGFARSSTTKRSRRCSRSSVRRKRECRPTGLGGSYALKAAATGRFERAVAFYGLVRTLPVWTGGGQRDALDSLAAACPTLAIFGEVDPYTPPADVEAVRNAWAGRPDHKVVVYPGADHAFAHDPDRPVHRPDDAADAWRRAIEFLRG